MTQMPPKEENVDALPGEVEKQAGNGIQKEAERRSMLSNEQASIQTSFLEINRPFFSPWNWEPTSVETSAPASEPNPRTVFEEGSLISFNIHEFSQCATESRKLHFEQKT